MVIIRGKQANVAEAKKQVYANLTQRGEINVSIPKAHHRFIIGKGAEVLKKIEANTGAKITMPKSDDASTNISIQGIVRKKAFLFLFFITLL